MSRSAKLYSLQQTDSELDSDTQRLAQVNSLLGETEELVEARIRVTEAAKSVSALRTHQRDLELRLKGLEQKRALSEQRLYGGKIRNPKELADLQEEIASLTRRQLVVEDELLETLLQLDESAAGHAAANGNLAHIETQWQSSQALLLEEKESLEARVTELTAYRQRLARELPDGDLRSYSHLRPRKRGIAVVLLLEGECQGCMTTVSAARVKEARDKESLAYCGTCGRMLCLG